MLSKNMSINISKGSKGPMTQSRQLMMIRRSRGQALVISKQTRNDVIPMTRPEQELETLE